jgi:lipopolysaccharide transport system permease protein
MTRSTNSMVQNAHIMTKVYFPRLILPISAIISPLVDFAVAFSLLIILMVYYGYIPGITVILLPFFIVLAVLTSFSVGLWLSALNVKYRDFQYTVPFLVQLWMFASPVVYPASLLPDKLKFLYGLNPMAGVIEGFRWVLLGTDPPSAMIGVSIAVVVVLCITGIFYFRRTEQYFADII